MWKKSGKKVINPDWHQWRHILMLSYAKVLRDTLPCRCNLVKLSVNAADFWRFRCPKITFLLKFVDFETDSNRFFNIKLRSGRQKLGPHQCFLKLPEVKFLKTLTSGKNILIFLQFNFLLQKSNFWKNIFMWWDFPIFLSVGEYFDTVFDQNRQ